MEIKHDKLQNLWIEFTEQMKKEIENIGKLRTRKKNDFFNVIKRKMKSIISKKSRWNSKKIFNEIDIVNVMAIAMIIFDFSL